MAIVVVLLATTLSFYIKTGFYLSIQILYVGWLLIIRPYEEWRDTACEAIQDFVFIILICLHIFWDTEDSWSDARTSLALNMIMASGLIVAAIMIIAAGVTGIIAFREWRKGQKKAKNKKYRSSAYSLQKSRVPIKKLMLDLEASDRSLKKSSI